MQQFQEKQTGPCPTCGADGSKRTWREVTGGNGYGCLSSSAGVDLLALSGAIFALAAICGLTGVGCLAAVPALVWIAAYIGLPVVAFCLGEAFGATAVWLTQAL